MEQGDGNTVAQHVDVKMAEGRRGSDSKTVRHSEHVHTAANRVHLLGKVASVLDRPLLGAPVMCSFLAKVLTHLISDPAAEVRDEALLA